MRRLWRVVGAVALYYAIWHGEALFRQHVLRTTAFIPAGPYFHDAPSIVNSFLYYAIPIAPLVAVAWFYRGGKRWAAAFAAVTLFVAFLWIPWLSAFTTPLPVEKVLKKAVEDGYEVCGVYRATTEWSTFVYEGTFSELKRCFFVFLRPEPRFNYKLSVNLTVDLKLMRWGRSNAYTFFYPGVPVSIDRVYLTDAGMLPDYITAWRKPELVGDRTLNPFRPRTVPYDLAHWFTFSPEPGGGEVKVTLTARVKAELSTPWN